MTQELIQHLQNLDFGCKTAMVTRKDHANMQISLQAITEKLNADEKEIQRLNALLNPVTPPQPNP